MFRKRKVKKRMKYLEHEHDKHEFEVNKDGNFQV